MRYRLLINASPDQGRRLTRGYQVGDRLVQVYEGNVGHTAPTTPAVPDLAEEVFVIHNRDDRPSAMVSPAMSVGDVVIFETDAGDVALATDITGFTQVPVPTAIIADRPYLDVMRERL